MRNALLVAAVLLAAAACSTPSRNPVPEDLAPVAQVPGFTGIRAYGGAPDEAFTMSFAESMRSESTEDFPRDADGHRTYPLLMISAGGARGAYGAGLLCGLTKAGRRPAFKVVTGVSTGALLAPFAMAGPEYDGLLEKMFTTLETDDLIEVRSPLTVLFSESGATTNGLRKVLETYCDDDFIAAIARAHRRGRRLWISTVNLDSQRVVLWDMGAIATSAKESAGELFRDVLQAACAVPVAFSPKLIEVEADGKRYDELHVDGGVHSQVFLDQFTVDFPRCVELCGLVRSQIGFDLYVIRNGTLTSAYQPTERKLFSIATRTVTAMLNYMAVHDIHRIFLSTDQVEGLTFSYASIPETFEFRGTEEFDPVEMKRLFDAGFEEAVAGRAWKSEPPADMRPDPALWKQTAAGRRSGQQGQAGGPGGGQLAASPRAEGDTK